MEEMSLEEVIKELERHKTNETDHYKDCGRCSRALEVAIKCLKKENNKSFEERNEEMVEGYLISKDMHELIKEIKEKAKILIDKYNAEYVDLYIDDKKDVYVEVRM